MKLETFAKIGISVGIALGIMLFFLLTVTVIPDVMNRYVPNYNVPRLEQTQTDSVDADFVKTQLNQTKAYAVFVERYPQHYQDLDVHKRGGHMRLIAINPDINNLLEMNLDWNVENPQRIELYAECRIGNTLDEGNIRVRDSAVVDFIQKTDCLD